MHFKITFFTLLIIILCTSCLRKIDKTKLERIHLSYIPLDYSDTKMWAALPDMEDHADLVPHPDFQNNQDSAQTDVFFVHPTLNISKRKWNAPVDKKFINAIVDKTAIKHQASVFNGSCRVYAPRYRQATIHSFFTKSDNADYAFNLAYNDVVTAFLYYMKHFNKGRKIIFAGHSQGTSHLIRLLREYENSNIIKDQMIVAYLIGMPVYPDYFERLKVCESDTSTNCFCSWSSFAYGHEVPVLFENAAVTNPLNWKSDVYYAHDSLNKGAVVYRFNNYYPGFCDAQIRDGVIWIRKPKYWLSKFYEIKNLHIADYNLFWVNLRENVALRIKTYFEKTDR